MRKRFIATLGITVCFVGLYGLLRNLPSEQCSALHYQVTKETANGVEMCSTGPAGLVDLERVRFPGDLQLYSPSEGEAGKRYEGHMAISGPGGAALLPHEIAITHAAKIHMMIVHESLADYHHLHPQPLGSTGEWTFDFTPRLPGTYHMYAECVPLLTKKQLIVNNSLKIAGSPVIETNPSVQKDLHILWDFKDATPEAGSRTDFMIGLENTKHTPIPLEEFMDAYSHVVAFRRNSVGYAHIHPLSTELPADASKPEFAFTFYTGEPGQYRLWAQFQIGGQSVFMPYDIDVR